MAGWIPASTRNAAGFAGASMHQGFSFKSPALPTAAGEMKMRGQVVVAAVATALAFPFASPMAALFSVTTSGTTFVPDTVTVHVGDTVEWTLGSPALSHTVTNGTGSSDPNAGSLFDAPLDPLNPTFSFTFTTADTVPYFCRPHELLDMKGVVIVEEFTIGVPGPQPGTASTWSRVKKRWR